ncbi:MAG: hypothetical protein H0U54_02540 [Acidobacteria bacterium]|nr:hypothetical protein [Acidobacteriota bacterium]
MDEENISDKETTSDEAVDDRGTNQSEGRAILKRLRDNGFESSDEKLAVALGRPVEEVEAWTGGTAEVVDDDVIMKARGIAKERGIEIE